MKHRIGKDHGAWTIERLHIVSKEGSKSYGKETWKPISWHQTLKHCLAAMLDAQLYEDYEAISTALIQIKSAEQRLNALVAQADVLKTA